jgi:Domain of unknown function (DUF1996)
MRRLSLPKHLIHTIVTATLLATAVPAAPALAADDAAWNVNCTLSHTGADDPIVYPNQPGKSHMHAFYGNTSTNAASTTQSLLNAPSSCGKGFANTDHSAYWIPALYRKNADGTRTIVSVVGKSQTITVYYRRKGKAAGPQVQALPQGFRMIAGDHDAAAPQPKSITHWSCKGGGGPAGPAVPTCTGSGELHSEVVFPSCWDGHSLDSADHKAHVAYAGKNGACPALHPISLPTVTFSITYHHVNGPGSQYELSSGGQYSMHGDFFAAWDSRVQNALVASCLNGVHKCTGIYRKGETLVKDSFVINLAKFKASPQILSDQTAVSAASPAPAATTAASSLPNTGPVGLASGAVGLTAAAYLYYQYRYRRRSLRQALLHFGRP